MEFIGGLFGLAILIVGLAMLFAAVGGLGGALVVGVTAIAAHRSKRAKAVTRAIAGSVVFAVFWFALTIVYWFIQVSYFDRGPLGYGFEVVMYETSDTIAVQTEKGGVLADPVISFAKRLQVVPPFVLAELHPRERSTPEGMPAEPAERFVLLDMQNLHREVFATEDALRQAAASRVTLALEPAYDVYRRHTTRPWFDTLCLLLAAIPCAVALVFHFRRLTYPADGSGQSAAAPPRPSSSASAVR